MRRFITGIVAFALLLITYTPPPAIALTDICGSAGIWSSCLIWPYAYTQYPVYPSTSCPTYGPWTYLGYIAPPNVAVAGYYCYQYSWNNNFCSPTLLLPPGYGANLEYAYSCSGPRYNINITLLLEIQSPIKNIYNAGGTLCGTTTNSTQSGINWWNTGNPACYLATPP